MELTLLKPISKIYQLDNKRVTINQAEARIFTEQTQLFPSMFKMEEFEILDRALSAKEILESYNRFGQSVPFPLKKTLTSLKVGTWNIWHGGKHWNMKDDGWDS